MNLIKQLEEFVTENEQEINDITEILRRLKSGEELFDRENRSAHFTASAWVVSPDGKKVLMAYHNIYDSWAWLGGHADGEKDLLAVALKEVQEESGLEAVKAVSDQIYSVEIITVDGHEKRGKYVPSHLHFNVTYLMEADPDQPVRSKPDENKAVAWFELNEALEKSSEPWMRERVYKKLNEKLEHTMTWR